MWVRGLKLQNYNMLLIIYDVAPYVGAWIETANDAGAQAAKKSHPMWVRGLKLVPGISFYVAKGSRTLCGCVD